VSSSLATICIAPMPGTPIAVSEAVGRRFLEVFGDRVTTRQLSIGVDVALDKPRNQYDSTTLLAELLKFLPENHSKLIGITTIDLFIPILTYVFGEAQLAGRVAIVSTHRLHNEYYGLPADEELLLERIVKESLHEVGHTYGLIHCDSYSCVMHSSVTVEDIDLKGGGFCPTCSRSIGLPSGPA